MGVMACARKKCPNIMCDRLIQGSLGAQYYICGDCWSELIKYRDTWPGKMPASEVAERIDQFMDSVPGANRFLEGDEIAREFDRLTRQSTDE